MWKESYRIGIDSIDQQHQELFAMVKNLLGIVARPPEDVQAQCVQSIAFLKDYVVRHFADEEAYQRELGYSGHEAHREIHRGFVTKVLAFERQMVDSNFATPVVKQFVGLLVAWLIHHVTSEDLRYADLAKSRPLQSQGKAETYRDSFEQSMRDVFSTMTGAAVEEVTQGLPQQPDQLFVRVGLLGQQQGEVVFAFPSATTFSIIQAMTFMEVDAVDEMVISALCEISNIVSGTAASVLAGSGIACDITTPSLVEGTGSPNQEAALRFSTEIGELGVSIHLG